MTSAFALSATEGDGSSRDASSSLGVSLLLHVVILAALTLSVSHRPVAPPLPDNRPIDISIISGDGKEAAIPKLAAPNADDRKADETEKQSSVETLSAQPTDPQDVAHPDPAPASTGATEAASPEPDAGAPDTGGSIWTPPAPQPNAADAGMRPVAESRERVVLPHVVMGKGATDAVLLSYDQGRYSDTASVSEALRLTGEGRITMSASVDDKGVVTQCVVSITSGSGLLDERACALISSYRYRPAQDAKGSPHASIVSEVLEWAKDGVFASPDGPGAQLPVAEGQHPGSQARKMPTVSIPTRS